MSMPDRARAAALLCGLWLALLGSPAHAQRASAPLVGNWSGGGRVVLPTGDSERASCRATFRQQTRLTFSMSGVCATPSARIAQTATLRQTGAGSYSGRFRNPEYDVTGSIDVTVRGGRMSALLRASGGGSARLSLSR